MNQVVSITAHVSLALPKSLASLPMGKRAAGDSLARMKSNATLETQRASDNAQAPQTVVLREEPPVLRERPSIEVHPEPVREHYNGDTAIKLYLREIGQVPLLTPEQEIELAARIKAGDEEARQLMIKANLRLVVKIAHDYESYGLPLLDLISEGNIGLMKAVERFDPAKGGKLSTYSSWWIKQSMKRALANQSKTIRLPCHVIDKLAKMRRIETKLQEEFGREVTTEELAGEMGISTRRVEMMRTAAVRPNSLDAPIGTDETNSFSDVVADENANNPYEELEDKTVADMLREVLTTLDAREATILDYRFGLKGGSEKTLEEVGEKFGLTRERIRQIQNAGLNKLRERMDAIERDGHANQEDSSETLHLNDRHRSPNIGRNYRPHCRHQG